MLRHGVGRRPRCIILAPTRELAKQVEREFQDSSPGLTVGCYYGGVDIWSSSITLAQLRCRGGCGGWQRLGVH